MGHAGVQAIWPEYHRTDHSDCDEVDRNLGDCSWDTSRIPQFRQDVKAKKFYSVSVWMKPTSTSWGMPRFFFPFLRLLSRKEGRPFTIVQMQDRVINNSHCTVAGMCPGVTGVDDIMQCVGSEASSDTFRLNTTVLNAEKGFADFLFTYSDNPIVVRQGQTLLTRNFFDSRTGTGKIVASFVSPENGVLTVLELTANFDGASISTASNFQILSFLPEDSKVEALWMAIGLFVALGFVLILSFAQIITVIRDVRAGERYSTSDLFEVAYDVAQVVIIVIYGIMVIGITFNAEKRSGALVQDLVNVPFVAPDQTFVNKVNQFFKALNAVFQELQRKDNLSTFGFAIMILNLVKVLQVPCFCISFFY